MWRWRGVLQFSFGFLPCPCRHNSSFDASCLLLFTFHPNDQWERKSVSEGTGTMLQPQVCHLRKHHLPWRKKYNLCLYLTKKHNNWHPTLPKPQNVVLKKTIQTVIRTILSDYTYKHYTHITYQVPRSQFLSNLVFSFVWKNRNGLLSVMSTNSMELWK